VPWIIERLDSSHVVAAFDCGELKMNSFLHKHALGDEPLHLFLPIETARAVADVIGG